MLEIRITAPELSEALNNLANAISKGTLHTMCHQHGENNSQIENAGTLNIDMSESPINEMRTHNPAANPIAPASAPQTAPTVPTAPVNPPVSTQAVPTAAPQYTLDMIARAGTVLLDSGKGKELTDLLAKYGVEALTSLDPAHYGAFATELRAIGGQI